MNRCSICPGKYHPIPGDGPRPARVLLVGERPGANENKWAKVFIGKTGQELDETYLPLANLHRQDVRICNTVLCWADNNRTPTDKEIDCCARHHLPQEIERTQPSLIILMGGSACKLVPSIKLDTHHGFPQWNRLFDYEGWILPMYHPALGLHESRWMTQLLEDWESIGERMIVRAEGAIASDVPKDYRIADRREIAAYLDCLPAVLELGADTEDHVGVPWSVQISHTPGTARLVRADDTEAIRYVAEWARESSSEWTFHFALHDLDILAKMGIHPPRYRDTQHEAYHLGNLPQGLKPLVYRLFGYTMTSWEDVVRPYSIEALQCWMVEALDIARADLSLIEVERYKKPYRGQTVKETVKKGPLESLLNRLLVHAAPDSEYDPWDRLRDFWRDDANDHAVSHIEARVGRYPLLGIANAPLARAVTYACGDADWTLQVEDELAKRRQDSTFAVAEGDQDL